MQADLDEAFSYNSCKKVAQLCRVMLELQNEKIDNATEKKLFRQKFEKKLNSLNDAAERRIDNQQNELIDFRRDKIDEYCVTFGAVYKQLKADYAQKIADIQQEYAKMSSQLKEYGSQIVAAEKMSLKSAAAFLDSTENDIKGLSTQNSKSNTILQKEMSVFTRELRNRSAELDKQHKENLKAITAEYAKNAKTLRAESAEKIRENIRQRAPQLTESRNKLEELEKSVKIVREDYNSVLKEKLAITNSFVKTKKRMIEELKHKLKDLFIEMKNMKKTINSEKSDFESAVFQLQKKMRMNKSALDKKISQINSQISRQKQQLNQLRDKIKMDKREKQMTEKLLRRESEKDIKMEKMKMQDEMLKTQTQIEELHKTTASLLAKSKKFVTDQLNILNKKKEAFNNRVAAMDLEKSAKSGQKVFIDILPVINSFMDDKLSSLSNESKENHKKFRLEFNDARKTLIDLLDTIQKESNDATANNKLKNKENISNSEKEITQNFESINARLKDRKNQSIEKEKVVKASFENDLQKKKKEFEESHHLPEEKPGAIEESSYFTRQKENLIASLNQIKGQIDFIKKYHQEQSDKLDFELSNAEKSIRTTKRKMTTDEEEIKKNFNDSINASQVKLTQVIDNLSQLYDSEANQRGSEIITQIRLIKDCKNSMNDNIMQIKREANANIKKINAEAEKIKEKIRIYSDGTKEKELNDIIANKESLFQASNDQLNNMYDDAVRELKDEIIRAKSEIESAKNEINAKIDEENAIFAAQFEEAQDLIESAKSDKEEKLSQMKIPHSERMQEAQDKHKLEKESIKSRIEAKKSTMRENSKELNEKYNALKKENQEQFDRTATMKEEELKKHNFILGDEKSNEKIDNLFDKITNILSDYINVPSDPLSFNSQMFTLVTESQQKSDEIENLFNHIIEILNYSSAETPTERKISGSKTSRTKIVRPSSGIVRRVSNV
ncbi:hypothetical protein TVAG_281980 [Trichomonas vaginalis G3]|uniref:Uncharacterized protein n=1 Tax=Trichomonas vaginalis (strain ATCC PRA-98 / G3) TaxID=412133 RepID=A2E9R3_TRIV3|nr:biological adhesion protein [Trichomonas vaginalis G3]EAY10598.1 hypothetical protein TVAG_281980 [Trichomonas vaginalis G3]KAI5540850.1 biological adhesion protein [Trichomonas vaginalis G3]|eukprot:XP_001322821.1 hypothetical protein [Trichomonas vaginalis G3]